MPKLSELLSALETLTSFASLVRITSLVLFVNLYLLYNYDISIHHLTLEWIKAHATVSEIVTFGVWFVGLHFFAFPMAQFIIVLVLGQIYIWLPFKSPAHGRKKLVSIYELRDFAVKNNNAMAYKLYENHINRFNNRPSTTNIQNLYFAILALIFVH
jgi:hypothetical protein